MTSTAVTNAPAVAPRPAIALKGVSKQFRLYTSKAHRLGDALLGRLTHAESWALRQIDLAIWPGETVGILGENGAGKSTLLSLVAGTSAPSHGQVVIDGRLSALLELGAGFHPEWTGRQNAEFYIRMMRLPKTRAKAFVQAVEAFADIGRYFDQPLRTYSSGMAVRVAFAAAVCAEPDVLIIDEALAVGDALFQHKCFQRIAEFKARGATILLVTHRLEIIAQLCTRAIVLNKGRLSFDGGPGDAVNHYVDLLYAGGKLTEAAHAVALPSEAMEEGAPSPSSSDSAARIVAVRVTRDGIATTSFRSGETAEFAVKLRFDQDLERAILGFSLKTVEDIVLYAANTETLGRPLPPAKAGAVMELCFRCPLPLPSGAVFLDFSIAAAIDNQPQILDARLSTLKLDITTRNSFFGLVDLQAYQVVE